MLPSKKYDIVHMITKTGHLYLFDIHSGKALYRARITTDTVFVMCEQSGTGGVLGITARTGNVLQVTVNEATLVPYIVSTLRDNVLGIALASRLNLPGADELYLAEVNSHPPPPYKGEGGPTAGEGFYLSALPLPLRCKYGGCKA